MSDQPTAALPKSQEIALNERSTTPGLDSEHIRSELNFSLESACELKPASQENVMYDETAVAPDLQPPPAPASEESESSLINNFIVKTIVHTDIKAPELTTPPIPPVTEPNTPSLPGPTTPSIPAPTTPIFLPKIAPHLFPSAKKSARRRWLKFSSFQRAGMSPLARYEPAVELQAEPQAVLAAIHGRLELIARNCSKARAELWTTHCELVRARKGRELAVVGALLESESLMTAARAALESGCLALAAARAEFTSLRAELSGTYSELARAHTDKWQVRTALLKGLSALSSVQGVTPQVDVTATLSKARFALGLPPPRLHRPRRQWHQPCSPGGINSGGGDSTDAVSLRDDMGVD